HALGMAAVGSYRVDPPAVADLDGVDCLIVGTVEVTAVAAVAAGIDGKLARDLRTAARLADAAPGIHQLVDIRSLLRRDAAHGRAAVADAGPLLDGFAGPPILPPAGRAVEVAVGLT